MTFNRPEHEYLRQLAIVGGTPYSPQPMDMHYLHKTALKHQLDGLLAYHLNEDITNYREQTNRWLEDVAIAVSALEGMEWYTYGSPISYLSYGLDFIPRTMCDLDAYVRFDDKKQIEEVAQKVGGFVEPDPYHTYIKRAYLPNGYEFDCTFLPENYIANSDSPLTHEEVFASALPTDVYGITMPVPRPEILLALWAYNDYFKILRPRCPIRWPAHIYNLLATTPNFDWDVFNGFLGIVKERYQNRLTEVTGVIPDSAESILFMLQLSQRVYGFPAELGEDVRPIAWRGGKDYADWELCRWTGWPGDEEFIFEWADRFGEAPFLEKVEGNLELYELLDWE